jgi:hypothetical protein
VRKFLVASLLVLLLQLTPAQQPMQLGPNDAIGFDYLDTEFTNGAVIEFQASWDAGSFVSVGVPSRTDTGPGLSTYAVIPPFATGTHSFSVRACNVVGCSGGTATLPFTYVVMRVPAVPSNVRLVPR